MPLPAGPHAQIRQGRASHGVRRADGACAGGKKRRQPRPNGHARLRARVSLMLAGPFNSRGFRFLTKQNAFFTTLPRFVH